MPCPTVTSGRIATLAMLSPWSVLHTPRFAFQKGHWVSVCSAKTLPSHKHMFFPASEIKKDVIASCFLAGNCGLTPISLMTVQKVEYLCCDIRTCNCTVTNRCLSGPEHESLQLWFVCADLALLQITVCQTCVPSEQNMGTLCNDRQEVRLLLLIIVFLME